MCSDRALCVFPPPPLLASGHSAPSLAYACSFSWGRGALFCQNHGPDINTYIHALLPSFPPSFCRRTPHTNTTRTPCAVRCTPRPARTRACFLVCAGRAGASAVLAARAPFMWRDHSPLLSLAPALIFLPWAAPEPFGRGQLASVLPICFVPTQKGGAQQGKRQTFLLNKENNNEPVPCRLWRRARLFTH